ncbi:MAG TPA: cytochrome c3 family protein [Candidatus Binatia bacterium]
MKRAACLVATMLAAAAIASACRQYLPSNRYLQLRQPAEAARGTADARWKFNHAKHAPTLASANVTCIECHRFDALIEAGNEELARELSAQAQYPHSAACHFCHVDSESRMAKAPQACTTCHENLAPLRPPDHEVAWLKVHANMSRANPAKCENCHRESFCIDCHDRRDTIQTRVHDRNFRFFHSVQVRANPMQCGSCHREDFCINCHKQGKVDVGQ